MSLERQRISIAIAAMGGQGGGVLADWLVEAAESAGFYVQATSVPGVAQRTGATIYYLELYPEDAVQAKPVLALMPVPGDVDLVIAAELAEAGRAVQRGIVTPDRTTLIASTHRAYALTEKSAMGDGRQSSESTLAGIASAARRLITADMQQIAEDHHTVVSASLFGAVAGSGELPIAREHFEAAIRGTGKSIDNNLAAFDAAFEASSMDAADSTATPRSERTPVPVHPNREIRVLLQRLEQTFAAPTHETILNGLRRVIDYQDPAYGEQYLDRLTVLARSIDETAAGLALVEAAARHLALWMSYEDTIRVADLKIRADRFARCREEVRAGDTEIVHLTEFMHPRVQEVADTLPTALGRWLLNNEPIKRFLTRFVLRERKINTSKLGGFFLLYGLAGLRRWRRRSLRFGIEHRAIDAWLARIQHLAKHDMELAVEVALCQNLIKGYGDTHARGMRNFEKIMTLIDTASKQRPSAQTVRELREAALTDENGDQLKIELERVA